MPTARTTQWKSTVTRFRVALAFVATIGRTTLAAAVQHSSILMEIVAAATTASVERHPTAHALATSIRIATTERRS